jgi:Arc/MetJ-type ribon-helix-helix transcriptional regulator
MPAERVTVTFPPEMVKGIDRWEQNRSRFIQEAVRHELQRRRREELHLSLRNPHPESRHLAALGLEDWAQRLPEEPVTDLVDPSGGTEVCWIPGEGWREVER